MAKHIYLVLTAAKAGLEAEFNDFYNKQHIPDVLRVPGFTGCRRLKLTSGFKSSDGALPYGAIYEMETDNAPAAIAELRSRLGTPQMPTSDYGDATKGGGTFLYDVIYEAQIE